MSKQNWMLLALGLGAIGFYMWSQKKKKMKLNDIAK